MEQSFCLFPFHFPAISSFFFLDTMTLGCSGRTSSKIRKKTAHSSKLSSEEAARLGSRKMRGKWNPAEHSSQGHRKVMGQTWGMEENMIKMGDTDTSSSMMQLCRKLPDTVSIQLWGGLLWAALTTFMMVSIKEFCYAARIKLFLWADGQIICIKF